MADFVDQSLTQVIVRFALRHQQCASPYSSQGPLATLQYLMSHFICLNQCLFPRSLFLQPASLLPFRASNFVGNFSVTSSTIISNSAALFAYLFNVLAKTERYTPGKSVGVALALMGAAAVRASSMMIMTRMTRKAKTNVVRYGIAPIFIQKACMIGRCYRHKFCSIA